MIFGDGFYFNGLLRLNLGWPTPNYAGAFLSILACFVWAVQGNRAWQIAAIAAEVAVYYLVAKTYSRGALVALMMAGVYCAIVRRDLFAWPAWGIWSLRAGALGVCVAATGFFDRVRPGSIVSDGAVVNRLELWQGGLTMMGSAPWKSWGAGESGRAYMNWFQDIDRSEGYATMVNSFLHVGVEYGAGVLGLVIGFFFVWFGLGIVGARCSARPQFTAACGAAGVAWATSNVFTTLWIDWRLWVVPAFAFAWLAVTEFRRDRRHVVGIGLYACGARVVVVTIVLAVSVRLSSRRELVITPIMHDRVQWVGALTRSAMENRSSTPWSVWTDPDVLGDLAGKELRHWLKVHPGHGLIVAPWWALAGEAPSNRVMLFGRNAARVTDVMTSEVERLVIVHPLGSPPSITGGNTGAPQRVELVLPEVDQAGNAYAWRAWADRMGAALTITPGVGTDIRAAWPLAFGDGHNP